MVLRAASIHRSYQPPVSSNVFTWPETIYYKGVCFFLAFMLLNTDIYSLANKVCLKHWTSLFMSSRYIRVLEGMTELKASHSVALWCCDFSNNKNLSLWLIGTVVSSSYYKNTDRCMVEKVEMGRYQNFNRSRYLNFSVSRYWYWNFQKNIYSWICQEPFLQMCTSYTRF